MQLVRIEPDVHRVFGAELLRRADARNARDLIEHARADDVVERVAVDRRDSSERSATTIRKPAFAFATTTPCCIDFARQARRRQRDLVLHLHLRDVGIGAGLERQRDAGAAVRARRRAK